MEEQTYNTIADYCKLAYEHAKTSGFWDLPDNDSKFKHMAVAMKLALVHSEISEALEADRKSKYAHVKLFNENESEVEFKANFEANIKDTFEDELADAAIRLFDLCGKLNIDLERHIRMKMRYNRERAFMHGKAY